MRPAPLQLSVGGLVHNASSSMYSQLPVNARFETTHANATSSAWLAISTGSRSAVPIDEPSGIGSASIGTIARSNPKPLAWS